MQFPFEDIKDAGGVLVDYCHGASKAAGWWNDLATGEPLVDRPHVVAEKLMLIVSEVAEENALLFARRDVTGMSVYVTRPPCARCAAKLVQAGIVRVVYELPPVDFVERWALEMREAQAMFADVGVAVTVLGDAC